MRIVIFGAGGRAGRRIVAEGRARGHEVTAASRDVADVTDAASVASLAAGHDAVVMAASQLDPAFFPRAAAALIEGLTGAKPDRLVVIGIGTTLETADGVPLYLTPGFPADARAFTEGHAEELELLRRSDLDWVVLAPPPVFLHDDPATGPVRAGGSRVPADESFGYADLAVAVLDEVEHPRHHGELVALSCGRP